MIKEFLEKHSHLRLDLQHLGSYGGEWLIRIYNTTYDFVDPVFEHYISDKEVISLNADFETIIMTPVINWFEDRRKSK